MKVTGRQMRMLAGVALLGGAMALPAGATPVRCRAELDREVLPIGPGEKAIVKITLEAEKPERPERRTPVNLCVVLDHSGSMSSDRKLERAKDAAVEVLRRLGSEDRFSLVIYDDNVETIVPAQSAANTEWIEARIREVRTGGNTALFGGVSQGIAEVRKHLEGKYVHRVILLSDGLANVGPSAPDDLGRLGAACMKEGISVTTVGVGSDYNEDLMTRLSQASDGNAYFVNEAADLARIFGAELGDVLSIVARRVVVTIDCPEGVRPLSVIGRDARVTGQRVEIALNQLYGGQEKFALVEVELPTAKPGERREIALARVSYEDPLTQAMGSASGQAMGRFSDQREEVERSRNATVEKAVVLNVHAVAQEQAVTLSDEGKREEAAAVLRESAQKLEVLGEKYDDEALRQRAGVARNQADAVETKGMSKVHRKSLKTDAYQIENQQQAQ